MKASKYVEIMRTNPALRAGFWILLITIVAAFLIAMIEGAINPQFKSFGDAVWWVLVTISTVGYGDKVPATSAGRFIAVAVMLLGIALLSVITATISSVFVARKIREGKGLEEIKLKNHILLCGWNPQGEQILNTLERESGTQQPVVLVNHLSEEDVNDLLGRFNQLRLKFVRGDFTRENILNRANVKYASAAIVLPDESSPAIPASDERTILATLSLKALNPNLKVYAHVLNKENLSHLKKAKADEVMISDAYSGYLLANHVVAPGVPQLFEQLFSEKSAYTVRRRRIPRELVGKTYRDLAEFYRQKHSGILLGMGHVAEPIKISELMSDDYSYLDAFIKRKFEESGRGLDAASEQVKVVLDPPEDQIMQEEDFYLSIERK